MKKLFTLPLLLPLAAEATRAHCPLCTVGAAAAAGGAAWMGVSEAAIGVFIGGFAVSMGWWIARMIKKQVIPFQKTAIILFSFATTIFPMLAAFGGIHPMYISIIGEYGSILNRTYLLNMFLIGSLIGGMLVAAAPTLSKKLTRIRGKQFPYQGISITFASLLTMSVILQMVT